MSLKKLEASDFSCFRWPILAEGGLIGGSNYGDVGEIDRPWQPIGVKSAVDRFFSELGLTKDLFFSGDVGLPGWWIFKPVADVSR